MAFDELPSTKVGIYMQKDQNQCFSTKTLPRITSYPVGEISGTGESLLDYLNTWF
jgi:hypothetical protein